MDKIIEDEEANVEYEEMLYERQQYVEQHSDELQRLLSEGGVLSWLNPTEQSDGEIY